MRLRTFGSSVVAAVVVATPFSLVSERAVGQFFPCGFAYAADGGLNAGASVCVDANSDGRVDIVTNVIGGLVTLRSTGFGTFSPIFSAGQATGTITDGLAAGDFNLDGKIDIARSSYENDNPSLARVVVAFGDGLGNFGSELQFPTGNWATAVLVGDIDGDADADIICGTELNGIQVWKSNGNGTFGPRAGYAAGFINRQMRLEDLNGDSRRDVIVVNETSNQFSVLINSGAGTFPTRATYATGSYPTGLMVADFDGDGDRDVGVAHRYTNEVRFFRNGGNGSLTAWFTIPDPVGGAVGVLLAADYDGDGDTDFTCVSGYGGTAKWRHFTNSAGAFVGGSLGTSGSTSWWAVTGHLDADSRPDVLLCENLPNTTTVSYRGLTTACIAPADCNGDGVFDYGQVQNGSLPDYDGDNVPDCCEVGTPCTVGNYPVQWRVEDGGNGHWYQQSLYGLFDSWNVAAQSSVEHGGYLTTITSASEQAFVHRNVRPGTCETHGGSVWIGGQQQPGMPPATGWRWLTSEAWLYTNWSPGEPNDFDGWPEDVIAMYSVSGRWNDGTSNVPAAFACNFSAMTEWSADCDADGVVDYGQILLGEVADVNGNGIPDTCDCPADINQSGSIDAEDLAYVLFAWGMTGGKAGGADVNGDATVDANDLSLVLGSWGPCPN